MTPFRSRGQTASVFPQASRRASTLCHTLLHGPSHYHAAAGMEILSRQPPCLFAHDKSDYIRDVLRRAESLERRGLFASIPLFSRRRLWSNWLPCSDPVPAPRLSSRRTQHPQLRQATGLSSGRSSNVSSPSEANTVTVAPSERLCASTLMHFREKLSNVQ